MEAEFRASAPASAPTTPIAQVYSTEGYTSRPGVMPGVMQAPAHAQDVQLRLPPRARKPDINV